MCRWSGKTEIVNEQACQGKSSFWAITRVIIFLHFFDYLGTLDVEARNMEWILLLAFSALVSIAVTPVATKVSSSQNPTLVKLQSSNSGKMVATTLVFFTVIVAAAMLMDAVGEKPALPGV